MQVMHSLVEEVKGESLRLDAGFNDRELVRKIVEFGMLPYVYPKEKQCAQRKRGVERNVF